MRGHVLVRIACASCALLAGAVAPAAANEMWVAPTSQQDLGGLGVGSNGFWPVTPVGAVRLAWSVPNDLQSFQGARVVLIPHASAASAMLNVYVCSARNGDAVAAACAGPFTQPFAAVANQLVDIDVSAAIGPKVSAAGQTYLAVIAYTTPTTSTDHIVGLRFVYAPVIPPGAATLGANTFGGPQTAPAFAGDGSALTNLPFPSGAAALGANTFTGTQTVDTGNVDLDHTSSSTIGVLSKNGAPFLHDFGSGNTFLGPNAGNFTMTGASNTVVGGAAFRANTTGATNSAFGVTTLFNNTSGGSNTALGYQASFGNTTGNGNTAIGLNTLLSNAAGSNNVAIGTSAGSNATGSNNIYIGSNVQGVAGESSTIYVGKQGTHSRAFVAGIRGVATANADAIPVVIDSAGQLGTVAPNGIATLAANTFTAAQTAPLFSGSFSGNGAALTNLPFPSGAAVLGANTFIGTQTRRCSRVRSRATARG